MPATRSSSRKSGEAASSPASSQSRAGSKRKAETSPAASPAAKNKKRATPKKQKTIEETLPDAGDDNESKNEVKDVEMKDAEAGKAEEAKVEEKTADADGNVKDESTTPAANGKETEAKKTENNQSKPSTDEQANGSAAKESEPTSAGAKTEPTENTNETATESKSEEPKTETTEAANETTTQSKTEEPKSVTGDAIEESSQREKATPSSILEKGIIYFFFRGRVGIDDPSQVDDIARSYIVLRPLSRGAKLTDGSLGDAKDLRLLALPKKVLPKSPKDRFMVFVEKSKASLEDLKKEFLSASDYETKTAGARHTPAATPIGEGVYALTSTGRETHLAYMLTIPKELSEVQKDIGLDAKGSWATSVKNPQHSGPAQAQLPNDAKFSQEILDEFRTLRWGQLQPKHLDYENCQLLLIGHKDHSFAKATETDDKEVDPKEEIEKLGEEDQQRVEHLEGDDSVFDDLNIDAKDYPSVQTTW